MAKVKNPHCINKNDSGKIGDIKYVKTNLSKDFTHKANTEGFKPKIKKVNEK